jgi:hypothetical protein
LKRLLTIFGVCALLFACLSCGKKESGAPTPPSNAESGTGKAESPAPSEAEAIITQRSIDYAKGLVGRKEYQQAREALQQIEARPLTAAQRKAVDDLKAQIPPG